MATVFWTNPDTGKDSKKHIDDGIYTLCGLEIPSKGKDWSAFGTPTCKRCIKKQEQIDRQNNV